MEILKMFLNVYLKNMGKECYKLIAYMYFIIINIYKQCGG